LIKVQSRPVASRQVSAFGDDCQNSPVAETDRLSELRHI